MLDAVDFDLIPGEVHVLLDENGAVKIHADPLAKRVSGYFLKLEPLHGPFIGHRAMRRAAAKSFAELDFDIDPSALTASL